MHFPFCAVWGGLAVGGLPEGSCSATPGSGRAGAGPARVVSLQGLEVGLPGSGTGTLFSLSTVFSGDGFCKKKKKNDQDIPTFAFIVLINVL